MIDSTIWCFRKDTVDEADTLYSLKPVFEFQPRKISIWSGDQFRIVFFLSW